MTTAITAVAALVLGTPSLAVASPPTTAPDAAPRTATGVATTKTVTLLTGDRVTVTASGSAAVRPGPGRGHLHFVTTRDRGQLTVLPQDAAPLVRSGRIDRRLFNVTELIAAGYDDARRDSLPVLVAGDAGSQRRAAAPTGLTVTAQLPAIGGVAATADKKQAASVWAALTGANARVGTAGGADRIWLDGRRRVTLDHSVPQIGAPAAHQAGFTGKGVRVAVLDTGIDAEHPDFTGRVAVSQNFSEATDAGDTVGHGTHVASIIAGSGAASAGKYRGVAPDATLLNGKVCEDLGCSDSAILAGMQWAAVDQQADVINMSLGGYDTPDVDPLEAAVESLTAQTGALFVISSGNDGTDGSVSSPSTAESALSVGAVDREDALADFSSRGPRVGDGGLKPDITAPGVEIVAARGEGTELGMPVGEGYVTLSGTSMAAPHVTGAVALLAQQHTGWAAAQLKATLMASAKPHPEQTAFQQGAGRVDVARAITQRVVSSPVSVSFGQPAWPHEDDTPIARKVDWRNDGPDPITLDLTLEVTGPDGQPAPAGLFTLAASQVTVPAGGAAGTTVTADTRLGTDGYWTGRIVARSGTTVAVTPVAVNREVESYQLTVRHLDATGAPSADHITALVNLETFASYDLFDPDGTVDVRVPKGRYGLVSLIFAEDRAAQLAQPELAVDGDTAVTVDARTAKPVRMAVPEPSAAPALVDIGVAFLSGDGYYGFGLLAFDFTGLTTGQLGRPVSGKRFVATIGSQWIKPEVEESPYLYALAESIPGRMPTGFDRTYRNRDLASVTHQFRGGYPGLVADRVVFPHLDPDLGGWAVNLPTTVPGQRVEHYNTNDVRWSSELMFGVVTDDGWLDGKAVLIAEPKAYRPGRHTRESWNSAPYGPSFPTPRWPGQGVTRFGDDIQVDVGLYGDADGHAGGSVVDTARTALYRDGKLVGESPEPGFGQFTVPPGNAGYRLEVSATRSFTDLSTEVSTAWTFRSRHVPGDDFRQLPVSAIRFTPPLSVDNAAPAGRSLVIPVQVQRQPGAAGSRVTKLTVDVSYDGGKTWQAAKVRNGGHGWTATVRHPAGPGYASLRASARDAAGNTVTERIIQAYRLR
ncbi:S8 family serine peptidase [Micromonospora sp. LAH09]|uniref:S8 family serine peptidase n=1 Tax=Micromonospora cabrerizensis TaxID=2911213 RepID=UPI001EE7B8F7|nr:S8 family serine peptidase [Micromonospora cabrerizensis]MCG5469043.1 S8 family serine peptidase [Micromonospora cabrerizensis]